MPSADKRARKKDNARAAREQREAAVKRKKQMRSAITVGVLVAIFGGLIFLLNIGGGGKKKPAAAATTTTVPASATATITTNYGKIVVAVDVKKAPIAAGHFIDLVKKHVYDGSRWHRVIKDFVIQGGAPGGDSTKDYGKSVVGEVPKGAYKVGDLAAAKKPNDPNGTFDSQFYIVTGSQGVALPPQYADFGHVRSGMDVVRKIEALKTAAGDEPIAKATIDKVTISES